MGLDKNVGLVGILTKLLKQKDKGSFPTTKKLKELMKEESINFLNEVKENLTNKEGAKNFYLKVKEEVKKILVIVSNLPDLESIDANGKKKLSNLKLEAEKGAKGQAQLMREASEKKYLKDPKILEWFSYAGGIMIGEYEKLAETKTYSSVSVEDSWYTRMQSNLETRQQATFKGWMNKGRSDDEAYERELAKRGIGEGRSLVGKSASQLEVTRGKLTGIKNGLKYGTVGGLGAGAALGAGIGSVVPVVGTAIGAGVGAVGGALAGGIGGAIFNGNRRAKKELKNIQRDRLRHLDAVDSEIARGKKLAVK
jgi:uncharacterized protein yqbO